MVLINDSDICYHHLGAAPQNKIIVFNILLIDIFGKHEPISTKCAEISVVSGE